MMALKIMKFIKRAQIWIDKLMIYPSRAIYGFLVFILAEIMGLGYRYVSCLLSYAQITHNTHIDQTQIRSLSL